MMMILQINRIIVKLFLNIIGDIKADYGRSALCLPLNNLILRNALKALVCNAMQP